MSPPASATSTADATPGQGTGIGRLVAPDLARGFMLLLIALAYAPLYVTGVEYGLNYHPVGGGWPDRVTNFLRLVLVDNRAYPMFAALFGYGLATMVSRRLAAGTSKHEVRRLLRRRGLFLLLFGLVHGTLVFPGEILGAYGLASLLLGWLMLRCERASLKAATVFAPLYAMLVPLFAFVASYYMYGEEAHVVPGYTPMDMANRFVTTAVSPVFNMIAYPMAVAILLGAWAGRRNVLRNPEAYQSLLRRTAVWGTAVSVAGGLPAGLVAAELWQTSAAVVGLLMTVQILTGTLGGLGYAALFGVIGARAGERRSLVSRALAATGARSLTFYLFNSVLLAVLLSPAMLGLGAHLHSAGAAVIAALVWTVGVTVAAVLERAGRRGPADVLLRRLAYAGSPKR